MRRISLATLVVGISIIFALSGCGGGGGGTSTPDNPEPPLNPTDWVLTGRVISDHDGSGVQGVTVSFGTPATTAVSDANGSFSLNLGPTTNLLSLFPMTPYTFAIDSSGAGKDFPNTLGVQYWGVSYPQPAIRLDASPAALAVLTMQSKDLGTLILTYLDPDKPPPPPPDEP